MSSTDYSRYSLPDFLADDAFVKWVLEPDEANSAYWDAFLLQHPQQAETIRKAATLISLYRKQQTFANESQQQAVWQRIETAVQHQEPLRPRVIRVPAIWKAAAILLITTFGAVAWMLSHGPRTITTAYGEVKTITLPDNSVVTLNSNSTLTYQDDWTENSPREVWIEGEGYFDVKHLNQDTLHIAPAERFIVHSREVNIEVLGTSFNVKNRRNRTNIGLISGKIKVKAVSQAPNEPNGLVMQPGDYVEFTGEKLLEKKKLPKPRRITTWTHHEITFANAYLREITEALQDEYGYSVHVKGAELTKMKIEGEINVANVQELLSTIATTLDLNIEQSDKKITIARK